MLQLNMSTKLLEAKIKLNPNSDVIFRQLISTDGQNPQWLDQNISAVAREPDNNEEHSLNSEDAFLLGVAASQGVPPAELRSRLKAGEIIYTYRPPEAGKGTS